MTCHGKSSLTAPWKFPRRWKHPDATRRTYSSTASYRPAIAGLASELSECFIFSEYARDLIRADQKRRATERIDALILEGLDSGQPILGTPEH